MKVRIFKELKEYQSTMVEMEALVENINKNDAEEEIWLLEHESVYTAGTSANDSDLVDKDIFPVHKTGRGGQYTYHGEGQRIAYLMLKLKDHYNPPDLKKYVCHLEGWIINSLHDIGIEGFRREGRVGIWVIDKNGNESKIAALGIRIRKWTAFHGVSININPNLANFSGIVPCGLSEFGVTSIKELGVDISMNEFDRILLKNLKLGSLEL
jgi:lipoyl(octanoyl) transferase